MRSRAENNFIWRVSRRYPTAVFLFHALPFSGRNVAHRRRPVTGGVVVRPFIKPPRRLTHRSRHRVLRKSSVGSRWVPTFFARPLYRSHVLPRTTPVFTCFAAILFPFEIYVFLVSPRVRVCSIGVVILVKCALHNVLLQPTASVPGCSAVARATRSDLVYMVDVLSCGF